MASMPGTGAKPPIAPPPSFDPAMLQKQLDDVAARKRQNSMIGNITDLLASQQSFGNFFTGKMQAPSNAGARGAQTANDAITDPMQRQSQLYANYKQASEGQANQLAQQQAANDRDPNSMSSKALMSLAMSRGWIPDDSPPMSKSQILGLIDPTKMSEQDLKNTGETEKAEISADSRESVAQELAASRRDANQNSRAARADRESDKADAAQAKAYTDMRAKLENSRGNPLVQQSMRNALSADNALAMVNKQDPNTWNPQQVQMFTNELAKISTGGVPGEHGVQALLPDTMQSRMARMESFFKNSPTPAQSGAFIKSQIDYLKDLKDISQKNISDYRGNIAKGYKNRVAPQDYQEAMGDYGLGNQPIQATAPAGNKPSDGQGKTAQFTPDVVKYAQSHGITADQAQSIKDQRNSQVGAR
jgi:hypothetical protein